MRKRRQGERERKRERGSVKRANSRFHRSLYCLSEKSDELRNVRCNWQMIAVKQHES